MATTPNRGYPRPTLPDPADIEVVGQAIDAIDADVHIALSVARVVLEKTDQPSIANNADTTLTGGWTQRPGHQYGDAFTNVGAGVIRVLRPMVALATVYTGWASNTAGSRRTDLTLRSGVVIRHQSVPPVAALFGYTISHAESFVGGEELSVSVLQNSGGALNLSVVRWSIVPLVLLP